MMPSLLPTCLACLPMNSPSTSYRNHLRTLLHMAFVGLCFIGLCLSPVTALADGYHETNDFADATNKVVSYVEEYGVEETLLVIDIDNTLLAMNQALGSDQWFEWQEFLLEHDPESPYLVAKSFSGLLEVQGLLFAAGKMHPPQPNLPELIDQVQSLGVPTLILTSRGDEYRASTERELIGNGYEPARNAVKVEGLKPGTFAPYELNNLKAVGLTEEEAKLFGLKPPRLVSYGKGIFMTAGQHKGAMLITLLHRAKLQPKAIVFIDDHGRHVNRVYDAMSRRGVATSVYHYHREDDNVARFRYSDKKEVVRRWELLSAAFSEALAPEEKTSQGSETKEKSDPVSKPAKAVENKAAMISAPAETRSAEAQPAQAH